METLIQSYLYFLKSQFCSPNTIRAYKQNLNQFKNYLSEYFNIENIADVNRNAIKSFTGHLHFSQNSNRTICHKLIVVREFFNFCKKEGVIDHNPAQRLTLPKYPKPLPEIMNINQINKLMNLPDLRTNLGKRDRAILEVIYSAGLRISEVCSIKLKDIEAFFEYINIMGKGRKERIAPLGKFARNSLVTYIRIRHNFFKPNQQDHNYLFVSKTGHRLHPNTLSEILHKYLKKIHSGRSFKPHSIRHSCATHMVENGASLRSVQMILGHSHLSTTEIYLHLSQKHVKESITKFHPLNSPDRYQETLEFYDQVQ